MPEPTDSGIKTEVECKSAFSSVSCAKEAVKSFLGAGPKASDTLSIDKENPGMVGRAAETIASRKTQLDAQIAKMGG